MGLFSFTFALAALGTESPQFYACLGLLVVLITWRRGSRRFETVTKIWEAKRHPFLRLVAIVVNFPTFLIGYMTLLLVIFGVLEKTTLKDHMPF